MCSEKQLGKPIIHQNMDNTKYVVSKYPKTYPNMGHVFKVIFFPFKTVTQHGWKTDQGRDRGRRPSLTGRVAGLISWGIPGCLVETFGFLGDQ